MTSIGIAAFARCSGLTSVVIGNSVTSVGDRAFMSCDRLTDIYFTGTEAEWEAITKGSDWDSGIPDYTLHFNYVPEPSGSGLGRSRFVCGTISRELSVRSL
jgi:hypothetical protein